MSSEKILTFPIKNSIGKESGDEVKITLKSKESSTTNNYIIHRAYLNQRHNERKGTANTLTRAEVSGGGRKPWRQKGTGRARAGSSTSPLWKGGGVSFGPKPKLYSNKINRKEWRSALRSLLIKKESNIIVTDDSISSKQKTVDLIKDLKAFDINLFYNTVIIVPKLDRNLLRVIRNIKTVNVLVANNLDLKQILAAKYLFTTKESLRIIEETYNG